MDKELEAKTHDHSLLVLGLDGWHRAGASEKRRGVQDGAIATQCRSEIYLLRIAPHLAVVISEYRVDGKLKLMMKIVCDVRFENDGQVGIGGLDMVDVFEEGLSHVRCIVLLAEQHVPRW